MTTPITPLELDFVSTQARVTGQGPVTIRTFDSYSFSRNILTPASPFRFTAPGIDIALRTAIRSGDLVTIWAVTPTGKQQIATGFIDETDTHIIPGHVEYVLTGRDTLGQLVDNSAVDANNAIINISQISLNNILGTLLKNTRTGQGFKSPQVPTGTLLFQTNAGETKINALQRYLEYANCLVWTQPDGLVVIGKPNFAQSKSGTLALSTDGTTRNNFVEARVKRNPNQAIRQIVTQLQTLGQVDAGQFTKNNQDDDVQAIAIAGAGRSVYSTFSYGQGSDAYNLLTQTGNTSGSPRSIGEVLSLREIARDNMKVIDVEAVVKDHLNEYGVPYNIDQIYEVQIDDDDVDEDMYVYSVEYELTLEHGMLTRLRLCRKGTICAGSASVSGVPA